MACPDAKASSQRCQALIFRAEEISGGLTRALTHVNLALIRKGIAYESERTSGSGGLAKVRNTSAEWYCMWTLETCDLHVKNARMAAGQIEQGTPRLPENNAARPRQLVAVTMNNFVDLQRSLARRASVPCLPRYRLNRTSSRVLCSRGRRRAVSITQILSEGSPSIPKFLLCPTKLWLNRQDCEKVSS